MKNQQPMHVLIVEDSLTMRRIIMNVLEDMGISKVDQATSKTEAETILSENESINMILSDWNLRDDKTGLDLIIAVRKNTKNTRNKLKIIMVTSESGKTEVITALKAGADDYLVKPFSNEDLKKKIAIATQELIEDI